MRLDKRGVSPVIAVLLLIVIAVAAAVLTYLWVLGYIGTVQSTGGTEQLQERIKIEGVWLSGNVIRYVYVRNIGDVQVIIDAIYVSDSTRVLGQTTTSATLSPGSVKALTTPSVSLTAGRTYIVKVVTKNGAEATYTFTYTP